MKALISFFKQSGKFHRLLLPWIISYLLLSIATIIGPEVLNRAVTSIEKQDMAIFKSAIILAIISLIFFLALDVIVKLLGRKLKNDYLEEFQTSLLTKTMNVKKLYYEKSTPADFVTKIVNYADNVVNSAFKWLSGTVNGYITIVVCVVYMAIVDFKLMIIIVLFNSLLRIGSIYFEKKIKTTTKKSNEVIKTNNSFMVEVLQNMPVIKMSGKQKLFNRMLKDKEKDTLYIMLKSFSWSAGFSEMIWATLKFSEYFLLYGIGGYFVFTGSTSFGTLISFALVADIFVKGINSVMYSLTDKITALTNLNMLEEFMSIDEVESEQGTLTKTNASIKLENVTFGFSSEKTILEDISLSIKKGEKILITGPNGQGKSTLLNIISGLYKPNSGRIYYGNSLTNTVNLDSLSDHYTYITQTSDIFTGSVNENIALSPNPNENKCLDILREFNMEQTTHTLPSSLSQGEKQRVNIARAFYKEYSPPLLLGDEIFSNIDKANVTEILELIKERFSDSTVIFVCHDEIDYDWDKIIYVSDKKAVVTQRKVL